MVGLGMQQNGLSRGHGVVLAGALLGLGACRNGDVPARTTLPDGSRPGAEPVRAAPQANGSESPLPSPELSEPDRAPEPDPSAVGSPSLPPKVGAGMCQVDKDCVPASCCHSTACVAGAGAPNCAGTMCTMECRGGTLDCGGKCACQSGRCTALLQP